MLGYRNGELIGKHITFIVDPEYHEKTLERIEDRKKGYEEQYELKLLRSDESELWTHVSATPLYNDKGKH